jgi:hypothetical protein
MSSSESECAFCGDCNAPLALCSPCAKLGKLLKAVQKLEYVTRSEDPDDGRTWSHAAELACDELFVVLKRCSDL